MLRVEGLNAGYGRARALRDVDLSVEKGEVVTILGPNGAGKTTLVNSVAGLITPWSGSVLLDGVDLTTIPAHRVSRQGIALVPEGRRIFAKMTVGENLDIGSYEPKARREHETSLARVYQVFPRLKERRDQIAGTLSGGEQQMLAMGRALMARPRLLLLDEPSLGLAPIIVESIFAVLRELNDAGISILLVEQNAVEALDIADRGYVLEEGKVAGEGSAAELERDPRLRQAYLGL